jgi:prevent-host-death family protein
MKTVTFTEFRNNASGLFSDVEHGQILVVLRHGRPIAKVNPVARPKTRVPSWKRPGLKLSVRGNGLSSAILEERKRAHIL